jgi:hypothetical protein
MHDRYDVALSPDAATGSRSRTASAHVQYEELTETYVCSANQDKFCTKSPVFWISTSSSPVRGAVRARLLDERKQETELIEETVRESMTPSACGKWMTALAKITTVIDPVIFVEAQYALSEWPIDPRVTAQLTTTLRDRLWERGETRFPPVRHKFDERQMVVGDR